MKCKNYFFVFEKELFFFVLCYIIYRVDVSAAAFLTLFGMKNGDRTKKLYGKERPFLTDKGRGSKNAF